MGEGRRRTAFGSVSPTTRKRHSATSSSSRLPAPGTQVEGGQTLGEVESTKSVSDIYAPVSGEVVARNEALDARPELVNADPYGEGWMIEIASERPSGRRRAARQRGLRLAC